MSSSIINRLVKGFSANAYNQVVIACTQLFGVPFLLHFWGTRLYGEWLILSAIPVYLSMADLGFSQTAGNDMTQRVARGDYKGALAVFQSIGLLIAICSSAGLAFVIALLSATPIACLLPMQMLSSRQVAWIIGLLAAEVLVSINEGTMHAGFRAGGGYAFHTALNASTLLIQNTALWLSAFAGGGAVAGAATFLVVRLLAFPFTVMLLVRRYPWIKLGVANARRAHARRLLRPAVANLAFPLARGLNIQGMRIVVGMVLGPIAVVTFTALRTLARVILQASMTISHACEPEFATAFGNGDNVLLRKLYVHTTQLTICLAFALAVVLFGTKNWILAFWTHGKVVMDARLFAWLMASTVVGTLGYGSLVVMKAANRHIRVAIYFMTAAGLAVALTYSMLSTTGRISDAGYVLMLMDTAVAAYVIPVACRLSGSNLRVFLRQLLEPFALRHRRLR